MHNIADIIDFIYIFIDNILTLYRIGIFDKWDNLRKYIGYLKRNLLYFESISSFVRTWSGYFFTSLEDLNS